MLRRLSPGAKSLCLVLGLCASAGSAWGLEWTPEAIAGQDNDADGIRDDVADYIRQQWRDSQLQFWALEAARASQAYLLSSGNPYALHRANAFMKRARRCLTETRSPDTARQVINKVLGAQLDSYERKQTYQKALDLWVHKVQHQDLPSRPDDNWSPNCGPKEPATTSVATLPAPREQDENLPPPNFFLGGDAEAGEAPSASVEVSPLTASHTQANDADAAPSIIATKAVPNTQDSAPSPPGSWTTYRPRPRAKPDTAPKRDKPHLPVQKVRRGQSAVAPPAAVKTVALPAAASQPPAKRPAATKAGKAAVPSALQELAPFIQSIEHR